MQNAGSLLPRGNAAPGAMFVCQDVDDLLDELHGCHMVAVLGCSDQVVTHSLLVSLVCRVLGTCGLALKKETNTLHMLGMDSFTTPRKCTFQYITKKMFSYMETLMWVKPNEKGHFCPRVMLINNSGHVFTNALRCTKSHRSHNAQRGHFSLSEFVITMGLWTQQWF